MKADYRVVATRCSNALQAASKALGKNLPCFAGLSRGGATVSDKCQGCLCLREALGGAALQGGADSLGVREAFQEGFDLDTLEMVWDINKIKKKTQKALL